LIRGLTARRLPATPQHDEAVRRRAEAFLPNPERSRGRTPRLQPNVLGRRERPRDARSGRPPIDVTGCDEDGDGDVGVGTRHHIHGVLTDLEGCRARGPRPIRGGFRRRGRTGRDRDRSSTRRGRRGRRSRPPGGGGEGRSRGGPVAPGVALDGRAPLLDQDTLGLRPRVDPEHGHRRGRRVDEVVNPPAGL